MTDATQWLINFMIEDVGRLVAGLLILTATIELVIQLKEWLSSWM